VLFPGSPLAVKAARFQEAVDDTITVLREYAEDWVDHLRNAANTRPTGVRPVHPAVVGRRTRGLAQRVLRRVKWPAPTRAAHDILPERSWTVVRNATGKKNVHHLTYELALADGTVPPHSYFSAAGRSSYGASMWAHIWRDQLAVGEAAFWACVNEGTAPDRGGARERRGPFL